MKIIKHSGWGRTHSSISKCYEIDEFNQSLISENQSGLAIGLGRSYGDTCVNSEGIYFRMKKLNRIEIDAERMIATCSADVTIGDLERASISNNLFPITVPGTEFVTIGGAIASNIHGKSHHQAGSFGKSLIEIKLLKSNSELITLYPVGETAEYFWATVGGLGLTGIIVEATIKLQKIENAYVEIAEERAKNFDELIDLLNDFDKRFLYTVAWIDLSGNFSGRGLVTGGNHASQKVISQSKIKNPNNFIEPKNLKIPDVFPEGFMNWFTIKVFNFIWFKKPIKREIQHLQHFLHPLDNVLNWNRIYGPTGFIQFQFSVPDHNLYFIKKVLELMRKYRIASFLGVLKKFGDGDRSLLGFPNPGWTLAVDVPANRSDFINEISSLMDELAQIGGRVYLSKDTILNVNQFRRMYPEYNRFIEQKKELDPLDFWKSDQGRRLALC